jgi:hypothetical protein
MLKKKGRKNAHRRRKIFFLSQEILSDDNNSNHFFLKILNPFFNTPLKRSKFFYRFVCAVFKIKIPCSFSIIIL